MLLGPLQPPLVVQIPQDDSVNRPSVMNPIGDDSWQSARIFSEGLVSVSDSN